MRIRRKASGFTLVVLVGLLGPEILSQTVEGPTAFTATVLVKQYDHKGVERYSRTLVEARRGDGSRATRSERFYHQIGNRPSESLTYREIIDLEAKRLMSIYPESGSIISVPLKDSTVGKFQRKPKDCSSFARKKGKDIDPDPEPASLLGFPVIKLSESTVYADGRGYSSEQWGAPDLDCFVLRSLVKRTDPVTRAIRKTTQDAVSIVPGEPNPEFFDIPEGFVERSPSEFIVEAYRVRGEECSECVPESAARADQRYHTWDSQGY